MNLLRANRQISHEAREVLYGENAFTITIDPGLVCFLKSKHSFNDFKPFPTSISLPYIKNWQLNIKINLDRELKLFTSALDDFHIGSKLDIDLLYIRDTLHSAANEMIKGSELISLKLKMPCICYNCESVVEMLKTVKLVLLPLGRLQFTSKATCICAETVSYTDDGNPALKEPSSIQCSEPDCLDFAAQVTSILGTLVSPSSRRVQLSSNEQEWLKLKEKSQYLTDDRIIADKYFALRALECGRAERIKERFDRVNAAIELRDSAEH